MRFTTTIFEVRGDTVQQGKRYPLLMSQDTIGGSFKTFAILKEDTLQRTLTIDHVDTNISDHTLYFNLQKGDSVPIPKFFNKTDSNYLVVDSIYTITDRQNQSRRLFLGTLKGDTRQASVVWIEGLGSLGGFIYPYPVVEIIIEINFELACVFNTNGNQVYRNPATTRQPCFYISTTTPSFFETELYPQPAQQRLHLESSRFLQRYTIINMQGKPVREGAFDTGISRHTLSVNKLSPGLYFIQIWDETGASTQRKVVIR